MTALRLNYLLTLKEESELKLISDNVNIVDGEVHVEYQRVARPRLEFQDRDRDFYNFSLNIETETETENFKVSMSRPRPRLQISKLSRPRLIETLIFQSCRDRDSSRL